MRRLKEVDEARDKEFPATASRCAADICNATGIGRRHYGRDWISNEVLYVAREATEGVIG